MTENEPEMALDFVEMTTEELVDVLSTGTVVDACLTGDVTFTVSLEEVRQFFSVPLEPLGMHALRQSLQDDALALMPVDVVVSEVDAAEYALLSRLLEARARLLGEGKQSRDIG